MAFWNLRAAGLDLRFVDRVHDDRLMEITNAWVRHLREQRQVNRQQSPLGVWSRTESSLRAAPDIGEYPVLRTCDDDFWARIPPLPHFHWGEEPVLAALELEGVPEYSFQLPKKPTGKDPGVLQNIGVTIKRHGDLSSSASETFLVPPLKRLNMFFSRRMYPLAPFSVRIAREYFTLCISAFQESLTIPAVDKVELVSEIFASFGIKAELSQPGLVAARLISQMGGLRGAGLFRFPGVRRLIEQYTPLEHFTRSAATECIRDLDKATGRVRFQKYVPSGSKWSPHTVFDLLLDRGIFRAGLEFRCPNCKLLFWCSIDAVGTAVTCELCGHEFNCTPQLRDRDWKFRRSGIFGKDDHQEGGIPVILTLRQLSESAGAMGLVPAMFTTAMKLTALPTHVSIPPCETDFVFVNLSHRGELNIAIGECKSKGGEITEDDLSNLSAVASAVDPNEVKVFLIIAKTGDFTAEEIARCKNTAATHPDRLIVLSQRELDTPHFTYEWAANDFEVSKFANDLDAMARQTDAIFFNPRPKQ